MSGVAAPTDAEDPAEPTADPEIMEIVARRGITEVLHFTTAPSGLVGICATGAVRSRDRLDVDKYIEYIYAPNCADRLKDKEWTDYVNLSISQVNKYMLDKSVDWHPPTTGVWWAVLSFDPLILSHPGVYFATTNNTYSATVKRGTGREGLEALFAPSMLWGHFNTRLRRYHDMPPSLPTHEQAEVLYPAEVSLKYLRGIYVAREDHILDVETWIEFFSAASEVAVTARPEVFA